MRREEVQDGCLRGMIWLQESCRVIAIITIITKIDARVNIDVYYTVLHAVYIFKVLVVSSCTYILW